MLRVTVLGDELFDESTGKFSHTNNVVIDLEHSLLSVSKWESKFQKPFLVPGEKTTEEALGYILSMVISPECDPDIVNRLSVANMTEINNYIDSKQTGTTFNNLPNNKFQSEIITSELIYYWMVALEIPFDPCEGWHLNRLLTLIRICNIKNSPDQKMPTHAVAQQYRDLNAQRKAALGTTG